LCGGLEREQEVQEMTLDPPFSQALLYTASEDSNYCIVTSRGRIESVYRMGARAANTGKRKMQKQVAVLCIFNISNNPTYILARECGLMSGTMPAA
jgi:hypothetical protein